MNAKTTTSVYDALLPSERWLAERRDRMRIEKEFREAGKDALRSLELRERAAWRNLLDIDR